MFLTCSTCEFLDIMNVISINTNNCNLYYLFWHVQTRQSKWVDVLVFCSKRLKLHTSIIIKLKSVQRLLWFQTICNRKCFVKKAHALNSRLQHDKEPYVTICSYCHTNLKISIANDDFWKEAKHFCLDVNTNFCSQFFVGQHFDFCENTKIYDG